MRAERARPLEKAAALAMEAAMADLARLNLAEKRIRAQISEAQDRARGGTRAMVGADTSLYELSNGGEAWKRWSQKQLRDLNAQLAGVLADQAEATEKARRAWGRALVAAEIVKIAEGKSRANGSRR